VNREEAPSGEVLLMATRLLSETQKRGEGDKYKGGYKAPSPLRARNGERKRRAIPNLGRVAPVQSANVNVIASRRIKSAQASSRKKKNP